MPFTKVKIENSEKMKRAIRTAKELKPMVKIVDLQDRVYDVVPSEAMKERRQKRKGEETEIIYRVRFSIEEGERWGTCYNRETFEYCKGMHYSGLCYHLVAAAAVNIGIRSNMRRAEEQKA